MLSTSPAAVLRAATPLMEVLLQYRVTRVRAGDDLSATVGLFRDYAISLGVDLAYQNFEAELAAMPGGYAPPSGELLLARDAEGRPVGCVGLRAIEPPGCCEMKRLYVAPAARGTGLGGDLVRMLVGIAEAIGYREMRLDTLPTMTGAQTLYRKLGFELIAPYYDTPVTGTLFMRRTLTPVEATTPGSADEPRFETQSSRR